MPHGGAFMDDLHAVLLEIVDGRFCDDCRCLKSDSSRSFTRDTLFDLLES
jgi:hypothetical protein